MSLQLVVDPETAGGDTGTGAGSGGGSSVGVLRTGSLAGSMVNVPNACQGPAGPEPYLIWVNTLYVPSVPGLNVKFRTTVTSVGSVGEFVIEASETEQKVSLWVIPKPDVAPVSPSYRSSALGRPQSP